jgi:gas vesicle protein
MTSKKNQQNGHPGIGLTIAAAAAAGTYFLYGSKDANKNRKIVKGWALKAKGEVVEKIEQIKGEVTEENYHKIVDGVMTKYRKVKTDHQDDIDSLVKDMKGYWKNIKNHVTPDKVVKKAVKKTAKKASK